MNRLIVQTSSLVVILLLCVFAAALPERLRQLRSEQSILHAIDALATCNFHHSEPHDPCPSVLYVGRLESVNLYATSFDLDKMDWLSAMAACERLGDRWRLPTLDELALLVSNQSINGGLPGRHYWSSTEISRHSAKYIAVNPGPKSIYPKKNHAISVRCVSSAI